MRYFLTIITIFCLKARSAELQIAVASNFYKTLLEVKKEYQKESGDKVIIISGSTGRLYAQIERGHPSDIFFSADSARPILLEKSGMVVPTSRRTYAQGKIAYWSPKSNSKGNCLERVRRSSNIAIANPNIAPFGKAALEVLLTVKRSDLIKKAVRGQNITQTFQFVASGNIESGIVSLSDLISNTISTSEYCTIPTNIYSPIEQQLVVIKGPNSEKAKKFISFLTSVKAKNIIASYGYNVE